jgi:hypothetical protein
MDSQFNRGAKAFFIYHPDTELISAYRRNVCSLILYAIYDFVYKLQTIPK